MENLSKPFLVGSIVALSKNHISAFGAPVGSQAEVICYSSAFVELRWINREKFANHQQRDGGYYANDFEAVPVIAEFSDPKRFDQGSLADSMIDIRQPGELRCEEW